MLVPCSAAEPHARDMCLNLASADTKAIGTYIDLCLYVSATFLS